MEERLRGVLTEVLWNNIAPTILFQGLENQNKSRNAVFWDVTPCGSCKDRRLGGTYRLPSSG
jgi:hypothetical protein